MIIQPEPRRDDYVLILLLFVAFIIITALVVTRPNLLIYRLPNNITHIIQHRFKIARKI